VERIAVELDDELVRVPGGIDLVPLDDGVGPRRGQVVGVDEAEEKSASRALRVGLRASRRRALRRTAPSGGR
jgi:hypothetical protein